MISNFLFFSGGRAHRPTALYSHRGQPDALVSHLHPRSHFLSVRRLPYVTAAIECDQKCPPSKLHGHDAAAGDRPESEQDVVQLEAVWAGKLAGTVCRAGFHVLAGLRGRDVLHGTHRRADESEEFPFHWDGRCRNVDHLFWHGVLLGHSQFLILCGGANFWRRVHYPISFSCSIDWLIDRWIGRLIDWLIGRSIDWLIGGLIDWLIDWLTD